MLLVDYPNSDSGSDSDDNHDHDSHSQPSVTLPTQHSPTVSNKRAAEDACDDVTVKSRLPPLPSSFHALYTTNARTSTIDDPALHGGRKRQVPHVQGNWPSHVFLECEHSRTGYMIDALIDAGITSTSQRDWLDSLILQAKDYLQSEQKIFTFVQSTLGVPMPLHISLSAPLILTNISKDNFQARLTDALNKTKVNSFYVKADNLDWVSNIEATRHFLILRLAPLANDELKRLLEVCNTTCEQFDLPLLYQNSDSVGVVPVSKSIRGESQNSPQAVENRSNAFHISIGWTLNKPTDTAKDATKAINLNTVQNEPILFEEVKIKIGNIVESVKLEHSLAT